MLRRLRQRFVWESTAPTGSKLSHLVAGERFYGSFSYLFPKQGTEYNPDRYPRRDRTIGQSSWASKTGCQHDPRSRPSRAHRNTTGVVDPRQKRPEPTR
jgi:hypothetical protein